MEHKISIELDHFKSIATRDEYYSLIDRIQEIIADAKSNVRTFVGQIENYVENLRFASSFRNHIVQEHNVLKIHLTSLKYPDAEWFQIIVQHIPETNECLVLQFNHLNEYGLQQTYIDSPQTISIDTLRQLLTFADAQEWHQIDSILHQNVS